jgi:hypothetical protein
VKCRRTDRLNHVSVRLRARATVPGMQEKPRMPVLQRLLLFATWLLAVCAYGQTPPADLVLLNGRIITSDPLRPTAEALAIRQDRILAVGSRQGFTWR